MRADRLPKVQLDYIVPKGGLDLVTPPMRRSPGTCRAAENFECELDGGYSRIGGYISYAPGMPILAEQQFYYFTVTPTDAVPPYTTGWLYPSQIVMGRTSGAIGVVAHRIHDYQLATTLEYLSPVQDRLLGYGDVISIPSGTSWDGVMYSVSGQFEEGEEIAPVHTQTLQELAWTPFNGKMIISNISLVQAETPEEESRLRYYCELGVALSVMKNPSSVYSSALGTTTLALTEYDGELAGVITFSAISNGAKYFNLLVRTVWVGVRGYWGWTPVSLGTPGSADLPDTPTYAEVVRYNFTGAAGTDVLVVITGAGKAVMYPPKTVISTGMTTDKPEHGAAHKNRLFLSFGGSLQYSAAGDPTTWSPVVGAGELAVGEQIIKLQSVVGGDTSVLLVYTSSRIYGLYGDSTSDFRLVLLASDIKVDPNSIQMLDRPVFLTENGLTTLSASDAFGNFEASSLSKQVAPFLNARRGKATASGVVRSKNQYRVFFEDGTGLYCTFDNGKIVGILPVRLGLTPVALATVFDKTNKRDMSFFAAKDSAFIYHMDTGTHFNGLPIDSHLLMTFASSKSPRVQKAYRKAALEIQSEKGYVSFEASGDTDFASMNTLPTPFRVIDEPGLNDLSNWDASKWEEFVWDGSDLTPVELPLDGSGENVSLMVRGTSTLVSPFTVSGATLHYIPRRMKR